MCTAKIRSESRKLKAFTLIEVMIVIAVAGLILAIIFLAVPQLERNVRDHKRKATLSEVMAEFQTYANNNQGVYPFAPGTMEGGFGDFYNRYIKDQVDDIDPTTGISIFGDGPYGDAGPDPAADDAEACSSGASLPTGTPCTFREWGPTVWVDVGKVQIYFDAYCDGETPVSAGLNSTNANRNVARYAMIMGLDRPGTYYCINS